TISDCATRTRGEEGRRDGAAHREARFLSAVDSGSRRARSVRAFGVAAREYIEADRRDRHRIDLPPRAGADGSSAENARGTIRQSLPARSRCLAQTDGGRLAWAQIRQARRDDEELPREDGHRSLFVFHTRLSRAPEH